MGRYISSSPWLTPLCNPPCATEHLCGGPRLSKEDSLSKGKVQRWGEAGRVQGMPAVGLAGV